MSETRYVPISYVDFKEVMNSIGADEVYIDDCWEYVWDRPVITNSGTVYPYNIRIYSSIDIGTDMSRSKGTDAIRIALYDNRLERCVGGMSRRVFRTQNALTNVRHRTRALFSQVIDPNYQCHCCGAPMVVRNGRSGSFKGCTRFPVCRGTREL